MAKDKIVVLAILLVCGAAPPATPVTEAQTAHANAAVSSLSLKPCRLPGIEGEVRCGTYEVFENRHAKSGRTINLRVVVLKALSRTPLPDPIFFLHGGPGAAATGMASLGQMGGSCSEP